MSGIVGSSHNIRGSGVVAKLGTDGQVFTSAGAGVKQTFEAAAGGGDFIRLATVANAGTGTPAYVDIDDVFSSTYKFYKLFISDIEFTDSLLEVSFLIDGTEQTSGLYLRKSMQIYGDTGTNGQQWEATNNADGWQTTGNWGHGTGLEAQANLEMTFLDPSSTDDNNEVFWTANTNQACAMIQETGCGYYNADIAATGIRIKPHANEWASGVANLYGVKAS